MAFGYLCRRCKFLYIYIYIYEVTSNDLLPSLHPEIEHNSVACAYTDLDNAYGEQLTKQFYPENLQQEVYITSNDLLPSLPPEIDYKSVACAYTDLDKAYGEQLSYMVDSCTFKHTIMAKVMLDPASL